MNRVSDELDELKSRRSQGLSLDLSRTGRGISDAFKKLH